MTSTKKTLKDVCTRVAPLWPLKNYIAVNPYMGFSNQSFQDTAKLFAKRSNIRMTLPLSFYKEQYDRGYITSKHLEDVLVENGKFLNATEFLKDVNHHLANPIEHRVSKTVLDLIDNTGEVNQVMIDNVSSFLAAYFDEYQAIWKIKKSGILSTWLFEAKVDRTPEIAGLNNFRQVVKMLPKDPEKIIELITNGLNLDHQELEAYFHTVLLKLSGWASYVAGVDWNNNLYASPTSILEELLCILLIWEYASFQATNNQEFIDLWENEKIQYRINDIGSNTETLELELVFQDAFDRAHQQDLIAKINANNEVDVPKNKAAIQSIFCIDVRSEVMRRSIENVNPNIETIGFAGFFGFPIKYKSTNLDEGNNQCPALIASGPTVTNKFKSAEHQLQIEFKKKDNDQFKLTWKSFKSGAVSAFSYVSPLGIFFLPKLIKDSFALDRLKEPDNSTPILDLSNISITEQVEMAANALKLIGIKDRLGELVVVVGHGSSSTNNPHASGLDCGACGGHSGKINAITAAQILNDPEVRKGLLDRNIDMPAETLFVGALHDTTTDNIQVYEPNSTSSRHRELIAEVKASFSEASIICRTERSVRFSDLDSKSSEKLQDRAFDWSQVRPEWGLSGCSSFIIGDRSVTKNLSLEGRAFLHNYDFKTDCELSTLETIICAPMVVTSWINLQYYASVTDNVNFGAGNKTLHNVTGGIGVIEGSGGDLKTGLPLQSIHDGEKLQHLPNRLNVFIQAPIAAVNSILEKHANIQALFDNGWISLLVIDENGKVISKYMSNRTWENLKGNNPRKVLQTNKELQNV